MVGFFSLLQCLFCVCPYLPWSTTFFLLFLEMGKKLCGYGTVAFPTDALLVLVTSLRAGAGLEMDVLYIQWLQPPFSVVSPWLQVGAQPCVVPAVWSPLQLAVSFFHKLQNFILFSADEEENQNQLDLTLKKWRSLSAMMHVRRDNALSFLFFSLSSFPLSFCRVDGC